MITKLPEEEKKPHLSLEEIAELKTNEFGTDGTNDLKSTAL